MSLDLGKYYNRIELIDWHIRKGTEYTQSKELLAEKVGVNPRHLMRYLQFMREYLNAPIVYNRKLGRYTYERNGIIIMKFVQRENI